MKSFNIMTQCFMQCPCSIWKSRYQQTPPTSTGTCTWACFQALSKTSSRKRSGCRRVRRTARRPTWFGPSSRPTTGITRASSITTYYRRGRGPSVIDNALCTWYANHKSLNIAEQIKTSSKEYQNNMSKSESLPSDLTKVNLDNSSSTRADQANQAAVAEWLESTAYLLSEICSLCISVQYSSYIFRFSVQ